MRHRRIPANVQRGAALLDERLPGWRQCVNPESLNMNSQCGCVIGQALGDYDEGMALLGLDVFSDGPRYGFYTWGRQTWASLLDAWLTVLS